MAHIEPLTPPTAKREPTERTFHGDTFVDDYEWMRDKSSHELQDFVAAENAYTAARMEHLSGLRQTLFDEFVSHVQQTDMSVPTRMDGYWYFSRTREGAQYGIQCRKPIAGPNDWNPPQIDATADAGSEPGEQIVFDTNREAQGHDFFRLGGMDISKDGRWMLYGTDTSGDERYDFRIRDLETGEELPEVFEGIAGVCLTPDAQWVFYTLLDDAWRPYRVMRHRVGTPVADDVMVFDEHDEHFWVGVGMSFDERWIVIGTGSKTTSEVLMLAADNPAGEFEAFIPRKNNVEYNVSFATFEGAGEHGEDIPLAVVFHNMSDPNFEIDVIDMNAHHAPYSLGDGVRIACGSPYGCEHGDAFEAGASSRAISDAYFNPVNPEVLQGARGLVVEGIALHRYYVALSYRSNGTSHVAIMPKARAAKNFLNHEPWEFEELVPPAMEGDWTADEIIAAHGNVPESWSSLDATIGRLYSLSAGGNPSYDAPRMRYSFTSYTRPGELHELDVQTGDDVLLKRANVLGDFDATRYVECRVWADARDGERVPVSLVWRRDALALHGANSDMPAHMPMFITGYGAYEISSDPAFSVARLSMLDRGVLYAVAHIRGGGEMGRAWYEQGSKLNKRHTFEDFIDATAALQDHGLADTARTVANGGSAGGLLMGAIANMAPERYAGIEADVPFVDALTSILDPSLPLTVTEWDEWGDPLHDERVYAYMKTYSPYENAPIATDEITNAIAFPDGHTTQSFPKIFITTSMNDTRVLYVEPLKWAARLQRAGVDCVIKLEVEAGHGGTSGRYKQWRDVCYENAWCLSAMGIEQ